MRLLNYISKITLVIALFVCVATPNVNAQVGGQKEKVESMRIAFITHRLDLTAEESKQFWPVYNNYRSDLATLRRNFYSKGEGDRHLSADEQLEFEQKKLDLKKRYKPLMEQAIGKDKMNLLVKAEEDFKRMLVQTIRNRREQRSTGR